MNTQRLYQERMKRIDDALAVKEPDRVPAIPFIQTYSVIHAGHTMAEAMYDAEAARDGVRKFLAEYEPDGNYGYTHLYAGCGPVFEQMGLNFFHWAGQPNGICDENSIHQFVEKPYLEDEEYPHMLNDMTGWIMSRYLPRNFEVMKPMETLSFDGNARPENVSAMYDAVKTYGVY